MHKIQFIFSLLLLTGISQRGQADFVPKIALDIGHSKQQPGAISARGKPEFYFNHDLALILQDALTKLQIDAFLIGEDGNTLDLQQRTTLAHDNKASIFLSIHHDSTQASYLKPWKWQKVGQHYSDKFSGFSLFISRKNQQPLISLKCARLIGTALKKNGFNPSNHHAEAILGENRPWADKNAGVYYYDDLIVLKSAKMPAVLFEAGVIVNRTEELNLQKTSTRHLIATSISQGLAGCQTLK